MPSLPPGKDGISVRTKHREQQVQRHHLKSTWMLELIGEAGWVGCIRTGPEF